LVDPKRGTWGKGRNGPVAVSQRRRQLVEELGEYRRIGDRLARGALLHVGTSCFPVERDGRERFRV
jgi:hypothetical protein